MRKYIIGFIVGLLAASALPVYGAVDSLIGKQVQAENAVIVNGKELDVKAVNINGTTYSPNRAIAEALNLGIAFKDGTIIFGGEDESMEISTNPEIQKIDSDLASIREQTLIIQDKILLVRDKQSADRNNKELQKEYDNLYQTAEYLHNYKIELETRKFELEFKTVASEPTELDIKIADIKKRGEEIDNRVIELGAQISHDPSNKAELVEEFDRLRTEGKALRKQYDELIAERDAQNK